MRKYLVAFFYLYFTVTLSAQIDVKSFGKLENDLDARVNVSLKDQNGDVCAIIKVVTTQTDFTFDCGQIGIVKTVQKPSEIWVYVPYGTKRITISHPKLGIRRDYLFSVPIEEASVYELVLTTGKVVTTVEEDYIPTQFVIITSTPDRADVFINEQHKGQTPSQVELPEGDYNYRVSKYLYYSEAGKFSLKISEGKKQLDFPLKSNYGFAQISTWPEGDMSVTIDGNPVNSLTPFKTDTLVSGKHIITVNKALFHEQTREVTIVDNQTVVIDFDVKPAFGRIVINSSPESGAMVALDGKETGKVTPCKLERVVSGEHTISLRKEWHEPRTIKVQVTDGKESNLPVEMTPTFGTIKITTDTLSEIIIDSQTKGKGGWQGRLIAGWHTIEVKKDKHHSVIQKIEVVVGEVKEMYLEPKPMYGRLKVVANAIGATIKLNGKDYGTTPNTILNLFVGDYRLTLEKQGYGSIEKIITVKENITTELNETLPMGMPVTINSEPAGAGLTVDGNYIGRTPQNPNLGFGNHSIKLVNGDKVVEDIITVKENGNSSYSFSVSKDVQVTISSKPSDAFINIDGKQQGKTPVTLKLSIGNHSINLNDGKKTIKEFVQITEKTSNLNFDFYDCYAHKKINSNPQGAKIFINGEYAGITPMNYLLVENQVSVSISKNGYDKYEGIITCNSKDLSIELSHKVRLIEKYYENCGTGYISLFDLGYFNSQNVGEGLSVGCLDFRSRRVFVKWANIEGLLSNDSTIFYKPELGLLVPMSRKWGMIMFAGCLVDIDWDENTLGVPVNVSFGYSRLEPTFGVAFRRCLSGKGYPIDFIGEYSQYYGYRIGIRFAFGVGF